MRQVRRRPARFVPILQPLEARPLLSAAPGFMSIPQADPVVSGNSTEAEHPQYQVRSPGTSGDKQNSGISPDQDRPARDAAPGGVDHSRSSPVRTVSGSTPDNGRGQSLRSGTGGPEVVTNGSSARAPQVQETGSAPPQPTSGQDQGGAAFGPDLGAPRTSPGGPVLPNPRIGASPPGGPRPGLEPGQQPTILPARTASGADPLRVATEILPPTRVPPSLGTNPGTPTELPPGARNDGEFAGPRPNERQARPNPDEPPASPRADLLSVIIPFDRSPFDAALARWIDRIEGLVLSHEKPANRWTYLVPVVVTLSTIEAAIRWQRRRSSHSATDARGPRDSALRGLY